MKTTMGFIQQLKSTLGFARHAFLGHHNKIYAHPMQKVSVLGSFFAQMRPEATDVKICERILIAYNRAIADRSGKQIQSGADIWTDIEGRQKDYFSVLALNDAVVLADFLSNMSMHDATLGTVQGSVEHAHLSSNPFYRAHIARMTKDKLLSLAEGVGAIPCENPEQGPWGASVKLDFKELVNKIEGAIGIKISPPSIDGGLFKIGEIEPYLFSERDCNSIYTAYLMRSIGQSLPFNICEIGGGVGRVAYWSMRMGAHQYTVIDLPHINVLQAFYLLKSMPEVDARLYGEVGSSSGSAQSITILPDFAYKTATQHKYDLIINQDSFPEIHETAVLDYLQWIKETSHLFLSINHESQPHGSKGWFQNSVPMLVEKSGDFQKLLRFQYWLRRGYVTELYRPKSESQTSQN
jgi:hypothetical protein